MFLFLKKIAVKAVIFALLVPVVLTGLLFVSCEQSPGIVLDEQTSGTVLKEDTALKSLTVNKGTLNPAFSASHYEYTVTVRNAVDSITVTASANNGKAVVNGTGTTTLQEGNNTVTIGVSAENGDSKTYTITVTRLDASVIGIESTQEIAKIGVEDSHPLAGTYLLMENITLTNWLPIGDKTKPFSGEFDGDGKTITLNSFDPTAVAGPASENYLGIFGYVKGESVSVKAVIKNLKINSSVNASTEAVKQAIGLVAGYAEFAEIDGITLSGTFTYQSNKMILLGGVAGWIQGDTIIKNSTSSVVMDIAPGNGSGLAVSNPAGTYSYVGGIAGIFRNGAGISNCHKTGNVTAVSDVASSQIFAGGIAGGSEYTMDYNNYAYHGFIEDSSFNGTIIGKSKGFWVFLGGIAGTIYGGSHTRPIEECTRILRCSAVGTVSTAGTSSGFPYVGGVVGYNYIGAVTAQSSFNGTVVADKTNDYTGGIAGYSSQSPALGARVLDCWSSGKVQGFNNAGGIVGQNQVGTYIHRCYSTAEIEVTNNAGTGIGGIAGLNASVQTDAITACVALNTSLKGVGSGSNIHRITGTTGGNKSNNHAWSQMPITKSGNGVYTPAIGDTDADGADCVAKPDQLFYQTTLGWNFANVWKMGEDGYPKLRWQ